MKLSVGIPSLTGVIPAALISSLQAQSSGIRDVFVLSPQKHNGPFRWIETPVPGVSSARNLACRACRTRHLLFLDDDIVPATDIVLRHAGAFQDGVGAVGGKILPVRMIGRSLTRYERHLLGLTTLRGRRRMFLSVPLVWGGNLSLDVRIFRKIGIFREDLGHRPGSLEGDEETEYLERLLVSGYRVVYEPNAVVYHTLPLFRLSRSGLVSRSFWQGVSDVRKKEGNGGNVCSFFSRDDAAQKVYNAVMNRLLESRESSSSGAVRLALESGRLLALLSGGGSCYGYRR